MATLTVCRTLNLASLSSHTHSLKVVGNADRLLWCTDSVTRRGKLPNSAGSAVRLLSDADRDVRLAMLNRLHGSA